MWYVYILLCKNDHLYTGITNNIEKRFQTHKKGKGAWYTRVFGAEKIIYTEECGDKSKAFIREREIKRFPRQKKLDLVSNWSEQST